MGIECGVLGLWFWALYLKIGILSYNSPITLYNTLLSYKTSGLLDYTDDVIVIIQPSGKNDEERSICENYNIKVRKYYLT